MLFDERYNSEQTRETFRKFMGLEEFPDIDLKQYCDMVLSKIISNGHMYQITIGNGRRQFRVNTGFCMEAKGDVNVIDGHLNSYMESYNSYMASNGKPLEAMGNNNNIPMRI